MSVHPSVHQMQGGFSILRGKNSDDKKGVEKIDDLGRIYTPDQES